MSGPMSQGEVETELLVEVAHLEALTNGGETPKTGEILTGYDSTCRVAAEAEAEWKIQEARFLVAQADRPREGRAEAVELRKARALSIHGDLYRAYKVGAAVKDGHKEALVTSRARLDALRTISANVRVQT